MPELVDEAYKVVIPLIDVSVPFYFKAKDQAELFKRNFPKAGELTPILTIQRKHHSEDIQFHELTDVSDMKDEKINVKFGPRDREIGLYKRYKFTPRLNLELENKNEGRVIAVKKIHTRPITFLGADAARVVNELYDLADANEQKIKWLYIKGDERRFVAIGEKVEFEKTSEFEVTQFHERIRQKLHAQNESQAKTASL